MMLARAYHDSERLQQVAVRCARYVRVITFAAEKGKEGQQQNKRAVRAAYSKNEIDKEGDKRRNGEGDLKRWSVEPA